MQEGLFVIDGELPVTSTEEIDGQSLQTQFTLSPNPSNGVFDIDLSSFLESEVSVEVTDNTGKLIHTSTLSNGVHTMDLSQQLSAGIYNINVNDGKKTIANRLMIRK